jgi:hypothetical protein
LAGLADIAEREEEVDVDVDEVPPADEDVRAGGMAELGAQLNQLVQRVYEQTRLPHSITPFNDMQTRLKEVQQLQQQANCEMWANTQVRQVLDQANQCLENALDRAKKRDMTLRELGQPEKEKERRGTTTRSHTKKIREK